ncbi:MAG TPA: hypothetical protein VHF89_09295 [Solirubrobacteraceae bacterium]|nr:hypothetical protein [Solirubrobacteraceae bacterium]
MHDRAVSRAGAHPASAPDERRPPGAPPLAAAALALQRGAGNRAVAGALLQRITLAQAHNMRGLAIRVDNSGQNALDGAAYLLQPSYDPVALMLGQGRMPTTAEWKATLMTTAHFILGFDLGPQTAILFLSDAFGGTGGTYAKAQGGTFEKVPYVSTAKVVASARLTNAMSPAALADWVVRQVEGRENVGPLRDDPAERAPEEAEEAKEAEAGEEQPVAAPPSAAASAPEPRAAAATTSGSAADVPGIADAIAARERDREDKNVDDLDRAAYADLGATPENWARVTDAIQQRHRADGWYGLM